MRKLEALLLVADIHKSLLLTGTGDVIDPAEDAVAIGSGGPYAYAAAMAYLETADALKAAALAEGTLPDGFLGAADIARKSLEIAAGICIYTNDKIMVEEIS